MKTFVTLNQNMLKSLFFIVVVASGFTSTAGTPSGETPIVKLSSFTALLNNNKVDLKWSTETEINLSHIMVEKSIDGKTFKDAALVFTYGNTTVRSDYSFADNIAKIKAGTIYYRLRTVAVDGNSQYSETCFVIISK